MLYNRVFYVIQTAIYNQLFQVECHTFSLFKTAKQIKKLKCTTDFILNALQIRLVPKHNSIFPKLHGMRATVRQETIKHHSYIGAAVNIRWSICSRDVIIQLGNFVGGQSTATSSAGCHGDASVSC